MATSYCVKCKSRTNSLNPQMASTSNGKPILQSTCAKCGTKTTTFVSTSGNKPKKPKKPKKGKGLFSWLGV